MKSKTHEHTEECTECGSEKRPFVHTCPESANVQETEGCPSCDDHCGFCGHDIGGEG